MKDRHVGNGHEVADTIEKFVELDWRRSRARIVDVRLKDGGIYREDHSSYFPFTTVRFKHDDPDVIALLQSAVASYDGNVKWDMRGHKRTSLPGVNWVIEPVYVHAFRPAAEKEDVGVDKYISVNHPGLALKAYEDLPELARVVENRLADYFNHGN